MVRTYVGVDIGSSSIKVVEVVPSGQTHRVARLAIEPTPPGVTQEGVVTNPQVLGKAIRAALDRAKIRTRSVNTALTGRAVIVREIRLPSMPDAELQQAVRFEAERYLPQGTKDVNVDFQVLDKVQEGNAERVDVLFAAARTDTVASYSETLRQAGVSPEVLEVTSFALLRAMQPEMTGGASLLADLGADSSEIVVVQDGRLKLIRTVPIGGNVLTRAVASALGLELAQAEAVKEDQAQVTIASAEAEEPQDAVVQRVAEAILPVVSDLITEVRRSIDYFHSRSSGGEITKVILSGGTARLKNLPAFIEEELGIPVEVADVFRNYPTDHPAADTGPLVAVATGLALRGADA